MTVRIIQTVTVPEGDGVTVKRLMPLAGMRHFDPFVLWDHFDISGGGFPDHPHRGFEAITYLFDGGMNHADNLGNLGTIHGGGAQAFTAGRGIIHSEFPDGHAHGIQLWINLPRRLKSIDPAYQQASGAEIGESCSQGVTTRTIIGKGSRLSLQTEVEYLDMQLHPGSKLQRSIGGGMHGFIYVVAGKTAVNGIQIATGEAALVEDETALDIASAHGARVMWCFGRAHGEPIHQHGPFVD